MSKLDEIISGYGFYQEREANAKSLKKEVKALFLEIVGEPETDEVWAEGQRRAINWEKDRLKLVIEEL